MSDLPLPEPTPETALDIQHDTDPAQDHGPAKRIPHLGHAVLFFSLALLCVLLTVAVVLIAFHITTPEAAAQHPLADIMAQLIGYVATLVFAVPLFSALWHRPFLDGISWTGRAVKLHWWKLLIIAVACGAGAQLVDIWVKSPADTEVLKLFRSPLSAWITVLAGGTIIPLMEEVAFRGFLFPALAIAYDWVSLERTPAGLARWEQTSALTRNALFFGAVISSILFVLIHGAQVHWAHGPMLVLFVVSLIFAGVRIYYRSVAAVLLVHFVYDWTIFAALIFSTGGFRHLEQLK